MSDRWTSPGTPPPPEEGPHGTGSSPVPGPTPQPVPQQQPGPQQPAQPQGWSTAQPPPGGPGWSPYPGGWAQPPAAPKPGVIPLRPLGVGEMLDGAVSAARAHWRPVLAICLGIALLSQAITLVSTLTFLDDLSGLEALESGGTLSEEEATELLKDLFGSLLILGAVGGGVMLFSWALATAMLTVVVSRAVLGRPVTVADAWSGARGRILRTVGLMVVTALAGVGAIAVPVLLALLTRQPGIVLLAAVAGACLALLVSVRFSLGIPALILERQGILGAMRRSWRLVGGAWWRTFWILALVAILQAAIGLAIGVPASLLASAFSSTDPFAAGPADLDWTYFAITGTGDMLATAITLPLAAGVTALLYMDRRIRREALDVELANAAARPGPDAPGR